MLKSIIIYSYYAAKKVIFIIFFIVTCGGLFSEYFRNNKLLSISSAIFALVSGVYLFKDILYPQGLFDQVHFDAHKCINEARKTNTVYFLKTKDGQIEVNDFRLRSKTHNDDSTYTLASNEYFHIEYYEGYYYFNILLVLTAYSVTPQISANKAAAFLQRKLCITKQQICDLNYGIDAPLATNVNYIELVGQKIEFEFCGG